MTGTPVTASSPMTIHDAVEAADLRVLVLCIYHLTGDQRWLGERFAPARDVRLVADPEAGFNAETKAEIRSAAVDLLTGGQGAGAVEVPEPVVTDPDPGQFRRMMSFCLGEPVPDEYVPMILDDFGFTSEDARWTDGSPPPRPSDPAVDHEVLIIGAGVSGMCLGIKLDRLAIPWTIIEKNPEVGGTWHENRYPGCGVDTPNHFYSYSFAPNPAWRRYFSQRDELHAYLQNCATEFDLRSRIRFSTIMTAARWEEEHARWRVSLIDGDGVATETTTRILVSATGHFNQPMAARFPGDEEFEGRIVHTARWPDDLDLAGAEVAVIGTGASSVQLVPTIAPIAARVTVYQRTPQWVRPTENYNGEVDPRSSWLFANLPFYGKWYRFAQFWRYGDGLLRYLRRDPDWPHPERAMNGVNDRHRIEMTEHIVDSLASKPELVDGCIPSYPPFGKRILLDNDWYATLCRSNVDLVTETIERFDA
ncbi:MAG: NAD(P)/FAD-dependent oxidoreductase, partial [Acidimicrobiia bacterium]|nr:NAD(P)/FAD-dependent oxidoreductase [Acidimicrobiia bacterium]